MTALASIAFVVLTPVAVVAVGMYLGSFAYRYQRELQRDTFHRDPVSRIFLRGPYRSPFPWHRSQP